MGSGGESHSREHAVCSVEHPGGSISLFHCVVGSYVVGSNRRFHSLQKLHFVLSDCPSGHGGLQWHLALCYGPHLSWSIPEHLRGCHTTPFSNVGRVLDLFLV